jgi:hypothetical protein
MNVNLLIDSIVRQTTVLIAQIATTAGARATLAHTANRAFQDLVRELKEQGLGNKVIPDMFGLTLRNYHKTVRRLSESSTERGRSLWEAVLAHVRREGSVRKVDVLARFARDDEVVVRSVLRDLVESGLVFATGAGERVVYRAAESGEGADAGMASSAERLADLVWVAVHHWGPVTAAELKQHIPAASEELAVALAQLTSDGRAIREGDEATARYSAEQYVIPLGSPTGWEAGVFDHYQAVVTAIATKLRRGARIARRPGSLPSTSRRVGRWTRSWWWRHRRHHPRGCNGHLLHTSRRYCKPRCRSRRGRCRDRSWCRWRTRGASSTPRLDSRPVYCRQLPARAPSESGRLVLSFILPCIVRIIKDRLPDVGEQAKRCDTRSPVLRIVGCARDGWPRGARVRMAGSGDPGCELAGGRLSAGRRAPGGLGRTRHGHRRLPRAFRRHFEGFRD